MVLPINLRGRPVYVFTFHSGYIPMHIKNWLSWDGVIFTFHSGYIPIVYMDDAGVFGDNFTFHSGYIPML